MSVALGKNIALEHLALEQCIIADFTKNVFIKMLFETIEVKSVPLQNLMWTTRSTSFLEEMVKITSSSECFDSLAPENFAQGINLDNVIHYILKSDENNKDVDGLRNYLDRLPGLSDLLAPSNTAYEQHTNVTMMAIGHIASTAVSVFKENKLHPLVAMKAMRHIHENAIDQNTATEFLESLERELVIASSVPELTFDKHYCEVVLYAFDNVKRMKIEVTSPDIEEKIESLAILANDIFYKLVEFHYDLTLACAQNKRLSSAIHECGMRIKSRKTFEGLSITGSSSTASDQPATINPSILY
jgi:hypothetical protein